MSISAQINIMDYNREERDSSSSSSSNNLDPCAKLFIEMKSIQPYSTKDEYIYAMKEDLAEWFNSMYSSSITAQNFTEELENGVLICNHANNVMRAASSKSITFNQNDLYQAGIIVKSTPNSKLHTTGEYLLYKPNARPQSFQARDNISNFIKWCRNIVKVREVLMFETEDLILRKNEKHFILCLLEVARFGSKFGIQVPTIIQMEQEIEAEMAAMQEKQKQAAAAEAAAAAIQLNDRTLTSQQQVLLNVISEEDTSNTVEIANTKIIEKTSYNNTDININKNNTTLKKFNSNENLIFDSMINCENNSNLINKNYNDSLEDISNLLPTDNNNKDEIDKNKINILNNKLSSSISSLSSLSSYSNEPIKNEQQSNNNNNNKNNQNNMDSICNSISSYSPSYLSPLSSSSSIALSSALSNNSENNNKQNENEQNLLISAKLNQQIIYDSNDIITKEENQETNRYTTSPSKIPIRNDIKLEDSLDQNILNESATQNNNNTNNTITNNNNQNSNNNNNNLHKHVCSIANRCTCEKKFLVDKIGEGKYRIGNTKNIVFIRILRNHIMVRVGGGWDTLENYLNKHDPCRCPSEVYAGIKKKAEEYFNQNTPEIEIGYHNQRKSSLINNNNSNHNHNILLKPVSSSSSTSNSLSNTPNIRSNISNKQPIIKQCESESHHHILLNDHIIKPIDFTDAQLLIKRDNQGKHVVGKILLTNQPSNEPVNEILNTSIGSSSNSSSSSSTRNSNNNFSSTSSTSNYTKSNIKNKLNNTITNHKINTNSTPIKANLHVVDILNMTTPTNHSNLVKNNKSGGIPTSISESINLSSKMLNNTISSIKKNNYNNLYKLANNNNNTKPFSNGNLKDIYESSSLSHTQTTQEQSETLINKRQPKKYNRSKTSDLDLLRQEEKIHKTVKNYEDEDFINFKKLSENDSLESDLDNESLKLNDSLESLSNINNQKDEEILNLTNATTKQRALWDKSRQEPDLIYFKSSHTDVKAKKSLKINNKNNNNQHEDILSIVPNGNSKRNLNLVKEKLYQMKKTIDAKVNLAEISKKANDSSSLLAMKTTTNINPVIKTKSNNTKNTPRKVKKKACERSLTTSLFANENDNTNTSLVIQPSNKNLLMTSATPIRQNLNHSLSLVKPSLLSNSLNHNKSLSLHNLATSGRNSQIDFSSRTRQDSFSSTISTGTLNSATPIEYKENKAYELRKKAALLNRIISKNNYFDPIYTRSHPTTIEISEQQQHDVLFSKSPCQINKNLNIGSYEQNSGARKRLFAKKNENFNRRNTTTKSVNSNNRSLSINDLLFYQLDMDTTTSATTTNNKILNNEYQSNNLLIAELIKNCEIAEQNLKKYSIDNNNLETSSSNNNNNKQKFNRTVQLHLKSVEFKNNKDQDQNHKHKRSKSLPSYKNIPLINIVDYDSIDK